MRNLGTANGITAAQLALARPLAHGDDIVPVPGIRNATRVAENTGAADVELTPADRRRIGLTPTSRT